MSEENKQQKYKAMQYDPVLAAFIERGDTVHTQYGIGVVADVVETGDAYARYIDYYVETGMGNYKLTRGEISKISGG